jgi:hypothetical protein
MGEVQREGGGGGIDSRRGESSIAKHPTTTGSYCLFILNGVYGQIIYLCTRMMLVT